MITDSSEWSVKRKKKKKKRGKNIPCEINVMKIYQYLIEVKYSRFGIFILEWSKNKWSTQKTTNTNYNEQKRKNMEF